MKAYLSQLPLEARWVLITLLGLSLGVALLVLFQLTQFLVGSIAQASRDKPHISRMLGYEASTKELKAAARQALAEMRVLAFSTTEGDGQSGAQLQQLLRRYAEEAGLTVSGSQLLLIQDDEVAEEAGAEERLAVFTQLSVELSVEGPPIALDAFLTSIESHTPRLMTVSLDIQRKRYSRRDAKNKAPTDYLSAQMAVIALKEPSS